jgi:hypothetical protein
MSTEKRIAANTDTVTAHRLPPQNGKNKKVKISKQSEPNIGKIPGPARQNSGAQAGPKTRFSPPTRPSNTAHSSASAAALVG